MTEGARAAWASLHARRNSVQKRRSLQPRVSPPSMEHHPFFFIFAIQLCPLSGLKVVGVQKGLWDPDGDTASEFQHWGLSRAKRLSSSAAAVGCAVSEAVVQHIGPSFLHLSFLLGHILILLPSPGFVLTCALPHCKCTRPFLSLFCCCSLFFFSFFLAFFPSPC